MEKAISEILTPGAKVKGPKAIFRGVQNESTFVGI
jgi:hypothetical protein